MTRSSAVQTRFAKKSENDFSNGTFDAAIRSNCWIPCTMKLSQIIKAWERVSIRSNESSFHEVSKVIPRERRMRHIQRESPGDSVSSIVIALVGLGNNSASRGRTQLRRVCGMKSENCME